MTQQGVSVGVLHSFLVHVIPKNVILFLYIATAKKNSSCYHTGSEKDY